MAVTRFCTGMNREYLLDNPTSGTRAHIVVDANSCIHLFDDRCPHRGGPLHLGKRRSNGSVVCPWHGMAIAKRTQAKGLAAVHVISLRRLTIVEKDTGARSRGLFSLKRVKSEV